MDSSGVTINIIFIIMLKVCKRNLEMSHLWRFAARVACLPALRENALTHWIRQCAARSLLSKPHDFPWRGTTSFTALTLPTP